MILFARVGQAFRHVEDREWLLLTLETLGVLVGILIAFSLQEWGQQRDEAAKHHRLMLRLFEESKDDISAIRLMRDVLKPLVAREQAFAVALSKTQCPPAAQFTAVDTLPMMPALTVPTSVYNELMGAGGLASVERKDVRQSLAEFHYDLEWSQKQIEYFRAGRVLALTESDPRVQIRFDPTQHEPEVSSYDAQALCRDHAFKNRVAAATRAHTVLLTYFQGPLEDAISVCVRLADSLGRKCIPEVGGPLTGDDANYASKVTARMGRDKGDNSD